VPPVPHDIPAEGFASAEARVLDAPKHGHIGTLIGRAETPSAAG
jgi:hypothetical protein